MGLKAVHRNIDLTTADVLILGKNPGRVSAIMSNDSDTICYIALAVPAVANQGIRLNANGGTYEINSTNPWFGEIHAISVGATKRLTITEVSSA